MEMNYKIKYSLTKEELDRALDESKKSIPLLHIFSKQNKSCLFMVKKYIAAFYTFEELNPKNFHSRELNLQLSFIVSEGLALAVEDIYNGGLTLISDRSGSILGKETNFARMTFDEFWAGDLYIHSTKANTNGDWTLTGNLIMPEPLHLITE